MTTHIMMDIESLGVRPGAVILSVALVRFTDEACVQVNLNYAEQQTLGFETDTGTVDWWRGQDPAAWQAATQGAVPTKPGLEYIAQWLAWAAPDGDFLLWCHGATFDAPLLEEAYRRMTLPCPWRFWQVRDTRTLYDLAGINLKDYAVPPPHVALNDAIAQTRAARAALAVLARAHRVAA